MKKSVFLNAGCLLFFLIASSFSIHGAKQRNLLSKNDLIANPTVTFSAQSLSGGGYTCNGNTSDLCDPNLGSVTSVGNWELFKDGMPFQSLGYTTGSTTLSIQFNIPPNVHGTFTLGVSYQVYNQGQLITSGYLQSNTLTL